MAQSFSTKKYFSKIVAHTLVSELVAQHDAQVFFDINDQTPRKLAIQLMEDSIKSLDTEKRLDVLKDLSFVASITSSHTASLGKKLFKQETGKDFEPEVECVSDADTVLYLFVRHPEITDKLAFLHPFYASKSYISYEAKTVEQDEVQTKLTELGREFTRLANKDDNATEQHMEHIFLDSILYISSTFHEGYNVESTLNEEGTDRKHIARKVQTVRIAYIPQEQIVLVAGDISKPQKMLFLDTFLRVVTGGGYEEKIETYDLTPLKNLAFDFVTYNKGTPFIKAGITSVTLSYAQGKKKLRIALPSSREHANLQLLQETLRELGLDERFASFDIAQIAFKCMFQNKEKQDKAVNVSCSISPNKATLCPLFEYERYTKSILKHAQIYQGFKVVEK
ncbi:MAG: hypothetical protein RIQ41_467 [Candidatus Parcubacteria bacterium]|jgi:Fe-S-cluster containining protein